MKELSANITHQTPSSQPDIKTQKQIILINQYKNSKWKL